MNAASWLEYQEFLQLAYDDPVIAKQRTTIIKDNDDKNTDVVVDYAKLIILTTMALSKNPVAFGFQKCVELKESPVHGMGVFATMDLSPGMVATFYPADIVEYCPNNDRSLNPKRTSFHRYSRRIEKILNMLETNSRIGDDVANYSLDVDASTTIYAHPRFQHDFCYLGHFVNDRFKPDGVVIDAQKYNVLSKSRANCVYSVSLLSVAIMITQPVAKNQELFASYGFGFWMNRSMVK